MSVAGLQEQVAQTMHVQCSGGASFYGHYFKCDKVHGMVDIYHAIPWSCDTFYYTLANRLGIDTIAKYATALGFGERTGIDLPDEASGTMPSTAWKMKNFHEKWYAGETISVGIGQGAIAATPLQLARAIGGIASGGALQRPHVVFPDEVPAEELQAVHETFNGAGVRNVAISPDTWQIITDAMAQTTTAGGTAFASHLEGVDFAGKTGTAQVIGHDALARSGKSHRTVPNSWFVGLAPRRNPDIVVAVLWGKRRLGLKLRQTRRPRHRSLRQQAARARQQPPSGRRSHTASHPRQVPCVASPHPAFSDGRRRTCEATIRLCPLPTRRVGEASHRAGSSLCLSHAVRPILPPSPTGRCTHPSPFLEARRKSSTSLLCRHDREQGHPPLRRQAQDKLKKQRDPNNA